MLNEGQVTLLWQRLFAEEAVTAQGLQRAEELIDQLRAESPLRFRLEQELREIRQLQLAASARQPVRRRTR
jgi:hypothetical protein